MARTSLPVTRTFPRTIRAPGRVAPSSASATVVFPDPDSPTRPVTAPRPTEKEISSTMSTPVAPRSTLSPETSRLARSTRLGAGCTWASAGIAVAHESDNGPLDAVGDEVDPDRQQGDQGDRCDHSPRLDGQADEVLVDHVAPIGARRLAAEAQERQRRDQPDRPGQAQTELHEDLRRDVGDDVAEHDSPGRDAERLRHLHEVTPADLERDRSDHSRRA